jgi:hypothetical protein
VGSESKFNTELLGGAVEIGILSGIFGEFDFLLCLTKLFVVRWTIRRGTSRVWSRGADHL